MKAKPTLVVLLAVMFLANVGMQLGYMRPYWKKNYAPKQAGIAEGLSPDQLLAAMSGFREMIAGILWVRADNFFDTGNYDAILPIIRLVTWLDPHQMDVYATGMWHIGYNFTDQDQRSDRRYLPSALALGAEGAEKNSNSYEMFFETGWIWYHKIDDLNHKAVGWLQKAVEREDIEKTPARKNLLATAYQKNGQISEAIDWWEKLFNKAVENANNSPDEYQLKQVRDTVENNLDTMIVRMVQRGWVARKEGLPSIGVPYDTDPPFDVGFSVRATVVDPKVLQVDGTWNVLPVGTRIRVILRDADFPHVIKGGVVWDEGIQGVQLDPPREQTYMQDQLYVRNRKFSRRIDMSNDPTMYPFTRDKYILEFYYSPRSAPPHIQDKFSWNGEGFTDKNHLSTDARPGVNVMHCQFELSLDEILRRGPWADQIPVRESKAFREYYKSNLADDVIKIPGMLAPAEPAKPQAVPPTGAQP